MSNPNHRQRILVLAALALITFLSISFHSFVSSRRNITYASDNTTIDRYVVLSAAIPGSSTPISTRERFLSFVFYLPLTALAWKILGYTPVIVIVGKKDDWNTFPILRVVRSECRRVGAHVVILEDKSQFKITMAQVVRLYASSTEFFQNRTGFILTSDADLWPIHRRSFDLRCIDRGCTSCIFAYHYKCCGFLRGEIRHLPMGYIGMVKETWRAVMKISPETVITTSDDIIKHLAANNYKFSGQDGERGSDLWYADQKFISERIDEYLNSDPSNSFVGRMPHVNTAHHYRVDRSRWTVPTTLEGVIDAHLPTSGYRDNEWRKVRPLLKMMISKEEMRKCATYREMFVKTFSSKISRM